MSDRVEDRLVELEELIKAKITPEKMIDTSGKYIRWLQSIIVLIVVVVGMGITWGMTQGKITSLEAEVTAIKQTATVEHQSTKVERDSLRSDFIGMQVKQASVDQLLNGIREDVSEIKEDVKKLTRGR